MRVNGYHLNTLWCMYGGKQFLWYSAVEFLAMSTKCPDQITLETWSMHSTHQAIMIGLQHSQKSQGRYEAVSFTPNEHSGSNMLRTQHVNVCTVVSEEQTYFASRYWLAESTGSGYTWIIEIINYLTEMVTFLPSWEDIHSPVLAWMTFK